MTDTPGDKGRWEGDCGVCGVPATQWNEVCEGYSVPRCYDHGQHQAYQAESRLSEAQALLEKAEAERDGVIEALDWAKAPTESAGVTLKPEGRVRALFSRERIDANQQRARALAAEEKVERAGAVLGELVTALDENADRLNISIALSAARDFLRLINGEDG